MRGDGVNRRGFLAGLAGGAVGWAVAGRPSPADAAPRVYMHPVPFIDAAQGHSLASPAAFAVTSTDPVTQAATFPQSVAAGDPNPNGAVIWTRVAPAAAATPGLHQIAWQVAGDPAFSSIILQGVALVQAARDNTVKLPLQTALLSPFSVYYYRFIFNGVASRTGRFKTMPRPGDTLARLKVGYVVCQDYSNGFYNAFGYLAQEDVDVVVHLGDYIYEYLNDGSGGPGGGPVRVVPPYPSGAQYPQGLDDYRHLYQTYRADLQLQAMHERFAMIQLWDDHEFFNDCHQDFHEDTPNPGESAATPKPALRQAANQAWWEHGLAAVPFDATKDWETSIKVYRTFRFGTLLELVVTDERLYRDGPPCGDLEGQRYQTLGCANQFDPSRTMLGATQKTWFLNTVTQSPATWKVWANEVMLCQYLLPNFSTGRTQFFDLDQWDGYPVERAQILTAIKSAGIDNFVVISGDAHLYLASYLKTDFNDPAESPMGVEFMVGAISSGNYLDAQVDAPVGNLKSITPGAAAMATSPYPADSLSPIVRGYNPHMQFWNGSTWGYAILTVTAAQMTVEFRSVSTIKQPTATLQELASFVVPSGTVAINHS